MSDDFKKDVQTVINTGTAKPTPTDFPNGYPQDCEMILESLLCGETQLYSKAPLKKNTKKT